MRRVTLSIFSNTEFPSKIVFVLGDHDVHSSINLSNSNTTVNKAVHRSTYFTENICHVLRFGSKFDTMISATIITRTGVVYF